MTPELYNPQELAAAAVEGLRTYFEEEMADRTNQPASKTPAEMAHGGITADELNRMLDSKISQHMAGNAREHYATTKMADLPQAYKGQLPETTDVAQLAKAEQIIRDQYRRDMAQHVPMHMAKGNFVGGDVSPAALQFQKVMGDAKAAFERGDLATAAQLTAQLQTMQQGKAATPAPTDRASWANLSSSEKIRMGLEPFPQMRR